MTASMKAQTDRRGTPKDTAPLRLVHNVSALTQEASGPSYSVVRLCDTLREAGHDVTLLTLNWAPQSSNPPYGQGFAIGLGPRRLGRSPAMYRWLKDTAQAGAVDVIHTHGLWMMTNVYPGWVAAKYNIPLVVSPRGTFTPYAMASGSRVKQLFWPLVQKPALAAVSCFHATAGSEYADIRRMGFKQPVAVIPNGIDLPALAPKARSERRTLLFLGRIHPNKGLDLLLPAWARVQGRFPDWDLVIVGNDQGYHGTSGHLDEMKALAVSLGLQCVKFEGARYGNEKFAAFRNADLYVLPTYSENFGMTVAEALSQETPAIVTKGAPWQGLEANDAGWWIDIGLDPLVGALEAAMGKTRQELSTMGAHGRAWMHREFLWTNISRQISEAYRWLRDPAMGRPPCVHLD